MAGHVGLRPTSHRHRLAATTVPGALAATEPGPHAGPSSDLSGCAGANPEDVAGQPPVECTTHRGRTPETRRQCGEVYGGNVPCPTTEALVTDMEDFPEEPCAGLGIARFLHRPYRSAQDLVRAADPGL